LVVNEHIITYLYTEKSGNSYTNRFNSSQPNYLEWAYYAFSDIIFHVHFVNVKGLKGFKHQSAQQINLLSPK